MYTLCHLWIELKVLGENRKKTNKLNDNLRSEITQPIPIVYKWNISFELRLVFFIRRIRENTTDFLFNFFILMLISKWRVKINLKNYIIIDFLILLGAFQNLGTKILRYNKKYWEFSGVWYKKVIFWKFCNRYFTPA